MNELSRIMQQTASDATGYANGIPGASAERAQQYRSAQREYQKLQGIRGEMMQNQAVRNNRESTNRSFVNSYGEATRREITSNVYEQSQRRLKQDVLRNMGY